MRLLIVEDQRRAGQLLATRHSRAPGTTAMSCLPQATRARVSTTRYAAVILDLGLPDGDGPCRSSGEIAKRNDPTPVLVLTLAQCG